MRFLAIAALLISGALYAQQPALREGQVYSYTKGGVRYYTAALPPADAEGVRAITYSFYEKAPPYPITVRRSFAGFQCTDDCSGHRAGYDWAHAKGVTAASQCQGRSRSFIEGCIAYAEGTSP